MWSEERRNRYWVRDANGMERQARDFEEWVAWVERYYGTDRYRVALSHITPEVRVSTVFLPTNHDFGGGGPPLIYETMVFGECPSDGNQWRCSTFEEAETIHDNVVRIVCLELGVDLEAIVHGEVTYVE